MVKYTRTQSEISNFCKINFQFLIFINIYSFYHAIFNNKNYMPFPFVIDANNRILASNSIPCLFNITIIYPRSSFNAISNMEIENRLVFRINHEEPFIIYTKI
jgi:hypothetical protein